MIFAAAIMASSFEYDVESLSRLAADSSILKNSSNRCFFYKTNKIIEFDPINVLRNVKIVTCSHASMLTSESRLEMVQRCPAPCDALLPLRK